MPSRKFNSIAVQGYVIEAHKSVILRLCAGIDLVDAFRSLRF